MASLWKAGLPWRIAWITPLNGLRRSPGGKVLAFSDLRAVRRPTPAAWATEGQDALVAMRWSRSNPQGRLPPGSPGALALGPCEPV